MVGISKHNIVNTLPDLGDLITKFAKVWGSSFTGMLLGKTLPPFPRRWFVTWNNFLEVEHSSICLLYRHFFAKSIKSFTLWLKSLKMSPWTESLVCLHLRSARRRSALACSMSRFIHCVWVCNALVFFFLFCFIYFILRGFFCCCFFPFWFSCCCFSFLFCFWLCFLFCFVFFGGGGEFATRMCMYWAYYVLVLLKEENTFETLKFGWCIIKMEMIIQVQSFSIQTLYPWTKLTRRNERHLIIKLCTCIITLNQK